MSEHNEDFLTPSIKYQMLALQGEALYETGEYRAAQVSTHITFNVTIALYNNEMNYRQDDYITVVDDRQEFVV